MGGQSWGALGSLINLITEKDLLKMSFFPLAWGSWIYSWLGVYGLNSLIARKKGTSILWEYLSSCQYNYKNIRKNTNIFGKSIGEMILHVYLKKFEGSFFSQ